MPNLLTKLIHDSRSFLTELEANNSHDWWARNSEVYEEQLRAPALQLIERWLGPLSRLAGTPVKGKLFRPYRDVQFSENKTPYYTHLHMRWSADRGGALQPAYFFGIAPGYVTLGAGQTDFDGPGLRAWQAAVDREGETLRQITDALSASGYRMSEPGLKEVPAPYASDHPQEAMLRRIGLSVWRDTDSGLSADQMRLCFEDLTPLVGFLGRL